MAASFFFYDLETSGISPRTARIMQFAGQRTDMQLNPIGEPVNMLIRLTRDVLPDPDAIMITGITPQSTLADGVTEAEFLKYFSETIAVPDTTFAGFNTVRFDDEFMRYLHYRNFYDAYEWQWCDGCSRWDLLDVVRMTRALRPDGISWPFGPDGKASNRLEYLTKVNKLDHFNAHDALSDVNATIAVAKLIQTKQPKLFQYLLDMRDKKKVAALVMGGEPFVYTSGKYPSEYQKTTVAVMLTDLPNNGGALVYDLRHDPEELAKVSVEELTKRMGWQPQGSGQTPLPTKVMRFNRCPAIAPISVLDAASRDRLQLDMGLIEANRRKLQELPNLIPKIKAALGELDKKSEQVALVANEYTVDGQLYSGFFDNGDRSKQRLIRAANPHELGALELEFTDKRLHALLPLYKARNYPDVLTDEEREAWEKFCTFRLLDGGPKSQLARYFERIQALATSPGITQNQKYVLEELRLYGESIMPSEPLA